MRLSMNVKRNMLREQEENGDQGAENYHTKDNSASHQAANVNKTGANAQNSKKQKDDDDIALQDKNIVLNFGTVDVDDLGVAPSDGSTTPH